jgi:hypothetical protein
MFLFFFFSLSLQVAAKESTHKCCRTQGPWEPVQDMSYDEQQAGNDEQMGHVHALRN